MQQCDMLHVSSSWMNAKIVSTRLHGYSEFRKFDSISFKLVHLLYLQIFLFGNYFSGSQYEINGFNPIILLMVRSFTFTLITRIYPIHENIILYIIGILYIIKPIWCTNGQRPFALIPIMQHINNIGDNMETTFHKIYVYILYEMV